MTRDADHATIESLQGEIERLRERVAELEAERSRDDLPYREIFDALPISAVVRLAGGLGVGANRLHWQTTGLSPETVKTSPHNILEDPQVAAGGIVGAFLRAAAGEIVETEPVFYDLSKSGLPGAHDLKLWVETVFFPVVDAAGEKYVVELHRDVTEQQRARREARSQEGLIRALLDNSPMVLVAKDLERRYTMVSRRAREMLDLRWEDLEGKTGDELFPREVAELIQVTDRQVLETLEPVHYDEELRAKGRAYHLFTVKFPLLDAEGKPNGICSISADVTERRAAEEENRRLQEEVLRVREAALRALSTPLIPIAKGVLAMPLIGDVDRARARQVLETLLDGVVRSRARIAILDVTGVTGAGDEVADGLVQVAGAVRLLGAEVVLTGIQPPMARVIAGMDEGLRGCVIRGTFESGIEYALRESRR